MVLNAKIEGYDRSSEQIFTKTVCGVLLILSYDGLDPSLVLPCPLTVLFRSVVFPVP